MAARKAHHPPDPGEWARPWSDKARPIFGSKGIAGYGDRWFHVGVIPRHLACRIVRERHYSGRIVNNSYVHLGVFIDGVLRGVMQFGYAMNPAAMSKVVAGTSSTDYLEINRMWLDDAAPRNSESRAIALALRYIRAAMPHVRWVQSFADERCGALGVVYQAASFLFVGEHRTAFYELDGETYHEMLLTAHAKGGQRGAHLRANLARARKQSFRQFRYLCFLHRGARRHLRLEVRPYPKREIAAGQSGRPGYPPGESRVRSPAAAPSTASTPAGYLVEPGAEAVAEPTGGDWVDVHEGGHGPVPFHEGGQVEAVMPAAVGAFGDDLPPRGAQEAQGNFLEGRKDRPGA